MKPRYFGILLIFLLIAMLAVSGCSSSSNKTTTLTVASQLYSLDRVHWFGYNGSGVTDNTTCLIKFKYEYADEAYKGVSAVHSRITANSTTVLTGAMALEASKQNLSELEALLPDLWNTSYVIDCYTNKQNESNVLGAHITARLMGLPMEAELDDSQLQNVSEQATQYADQSKSRSPMAKAGEETITVDGKTYDCTKYTFSSEYSGMTVPYTVWYTPQVPVPVRMIYTMQIKGTGPVEYSMDLAGWG